MSSDGWNVPTAPDEREDATVTQLPTQQGASSADRPTDPAGASLPAGSEPMATADSVLGAWALTVGEALSAHADDRAITEHQRRAMQAMQAIDAAQSDRGQALDQIASSVHDYEAGVELALRAVGVPLQRARPAVDPNAVVDLAAVQHEMAAVARSLRDDVMHVAAARSQAQEEANGLVNVPTSAASMRDKFIAIAGGLLVVGAVIVGVTG